MSSRLAVTDALRQSEGLGRLAVARLLSTLGEGAHQAALAGVVLFAPESAATPPAITVAFAVLVLPYSAIGPFAAAALDRWDRRRVIAAAGVLRALIIAATIASILAGALTRASGLSALFGLTLLALGLGRLVNTGMTASLPHVVAPALLPAANSFTVTAGSLASAGGAVAALVVVGAVGGDGVAVATTLSIALALGLVGCLLVFTLPRGHLGPPETTDFRPQRGWALAVARTFGAGLAAGWRASRRSRFVSVALAGIGLSRAAFGITTLAIVLYFRAQPGPMIAGIGGFSLVMAVYAAGMGLAAFVVPPLLRTRGGYFVIAAGAAASVAAQFAVGAADSPASPAVCGFVLGLGGQMIKLAGDNAMQTEIPDSERGGVFALQDAIFNASFVAGMAAVAWLIPPTEVPDVLLAGAATLQLAVIALVLAARKRGSSSSVAG